MDIDKTAKLVYLLILVTIAFLHPVIQRKS